VFSATETDRTFRETVERLRVPGMGTEVVAPLLEHLVHLVRPRRVLEIGMGYTTPFLARALTDIAARHAAEADALAAKSQPYVARGRPVDASWIEAEPALLVPGEYRERFDPVFAAVDDLSMADSSAPAVREVLEELGLAGAVTVINARMRDCVDLLPERLLPIDFAWVDAWDCLYFFDKFWDLVNPDGGIVAFHYLMTYPEGEAVLEYIAETQRLRPGGFEVVSFLESHKLRQNSLTVLRRTDGAASRRYSDEQQRPRLEAALQRDAAALVAQRTALRAGGG